MIKGKSIKGRTPTIGVVAISAPEAKWNPDIFQKGKEALSTRGCKIIESQTIFTNYFYLAEKPEKIADSIKDMFANEKVDMIMCAGGGNCMNKIIPYIDFNFIKLHYKPFVGISDITAFLLSMLNEGIVSFHGPFVLWNYGVKGTPTDYTHNNLIDVLNGYIGEFPANSEWKIYQYGNATGKIIGGNISTICNIVGTQYCPIDIFNDSILFIEDIGETLASLDSKLTYLRLLGIFDKIRGVVFGKLPECDPPEEDMSIDVTDFFDLVFGGYQFPIIYDCDFGHIDNNLCLPLGCNVTIEANRKTVPRIILNESGVN
ncbi:MAG: LD-carboxypeptidase [Lachnospiraceae bacterium]|nr:LD-carboxypeptidase [Lachnospiraceae bacterium]